MKRAAILLITIFAVLLAPSSAPALAPPATLDYELSNNPRHIVKQGVGADGQFQPNDSAQALNVAGAHANIFGLLDFGQGNPWNGGQLGPIRDLKVDMPTGWTGAAAKAARCSQALFDRASCVDPPPSYADAVSGIDRQEEPASRWPQTASKVAYGGAFSGSIDIHTHQVNLVPPANAPAKLGLGSRQVSQQTVPREIAVRAATDTGVATNLKDFYVTAAGSATWFNQLYEGVCAQVGCPDAWVPGRPYFSTNPTACYKPARIVARINTTKDPTYRVASAEQPIDGCMPVYFGSLPLGGLVTALNPTLNKPSVEITPEDGSNDDKVEAGTGSGFQVAINVPENADDANDPSGVDDFNFTQNPDAAHLAPKGSSHLYRIETKLPKGMNLSVNAAKHLEGCTDAQFGINPVKPADYAPGGPLHDTEYDPESANYDPAFSPLRGNGQRAQCPAGSQVGTANVYSPAVDGDPTTPSVFFDESNFFNPQNGVAIPGGQEPVEGKVFLRQPDTPGAPTKAHPWQIFIALDDIGLNVKLAGDMYFEDGRIVSVFDQSPQTPFTRFELNFNGGNDSVLQAPRTCGDNEMEMKLYPWAGVLPPASGQPVQPPAENTAETVTDSFLTTGCSDSYSLDLSASSNPEAPGAETASKIVLRRDDNEDFIKNLKIRLSPGIIGSLRVPQCSLAAVQTDSCPQNTKVGRLVAKVGTGPDPLQVDGSLYLAEPSVPGDAATVAAIVPTKVGPIDLGGPVIHLNRVQVDSKTAALTVRSIGDIPAKIDGIPLPIQELTIDVSRKGFMRNGTSCAQMTEYVDSNSQDPDDPGDSKAHTASYSHALSGCEALPFAPKLTLTAGEPNVDQTGLRAHPTIRATVTQGDGEANISSARVVLPDALRPDTVNINKPGTLCLPDQLGAGQCPGSSIAGQAKATTPLLPDPISGPVSLIQRQAGALPDLAIALQGAVSIDLLARNELKVPNTINTFESIPDVPQSSFELTVNGSRERGILLNFFDLCTGAKDANRIADVTFTAHSGAVHRARPRLKVLGCERYAGKALAGKVKILRKKRRVSVALTCPGEKDCKGRVTVKGRIRGKRRSAIAAGSFSIPAQSSDRVELALSRKARKAMKRLARQKLGVTLAS